MIKPQEQTINHWPIAWPESVLTALYCFKLKRIMSGCSERDEMGVSETSVKSSSSWQFWTRIHASLTDGWMFARQWCSLACETSGPSKL